MDRHVYERAMVLQHYLNTSRLNDLNPTGKELRSMMNVLTVGWGHGGDGGHVEVVEKLLKRRGIIK